MKLRIGNAGCFNHRISLPFSSITYSYPSQSLNLILFVSISTPLAQACSSVRLDTHDLQRPLTSAKHDALNKYKIYKTFRCTSIVTGTTVQPCLRLINKTGRYRVEMNVLKLLINHLVRT